MNIEPPKYSCERIVAAVLRITAVSCICLLAACQTSPPVQEMSDARQAIAAAIEAGAGTKAEAELKMAKEHLDAAEERISEKAYTAARREAMNAKQNALDALSIAEQQQDQSQP